MYHRESYRIKAVPPGNWKDEKFMLFFVTLLLCYFQIPQNTKGPKTRILSFSFPFLPSLILAALECLGRRQINVNERLVSVPLPTLAYIYVDLTPT
jgi:hypothetical protein